MLASWIQKHGSLMSRETDIAVRYSNAVLNVAACEERLRRARELARDFPHVGRYQRRIHCARSDLKDAKRLQAYLKAQLP